MGEAGLCSERSDRLDEAGGRIGWTKRAVGAGFIAAYIYFVQNSLQMSSILLKG